MPTGRRVHLHQDVQVCCRLVCKRRRSFRTNKRTANPNYSMMAWNLNLRNHASLIGTFIPMHAAWFCITQISLIPQSTTSSLITLSFSLLTRSIQKNSRRMLFFGAENCKVNNAHPCETDWKTFGLLPGIKRQGEMKSL